MTTPDAALTVEAPDVRRRRRRSERRDRVYDAAVALFVEQGYDGTTMDHIAARADVARTSVFNYFERKSAFLDEWAARRRSRAFATVTDDGVPARERLATLMGAFAEVSVSTRPETVALFVPALRELNLLDQSAFSAELAVWIGVHVADEVVGDDVDRELVSLVLSTGYFAILTAWCSGDEPPFDLGDRLRRLATLVTDGVIDAPPATAP